MAPGANMLCSFSQAKTNGPWVHLTDEAEAQGGNLLKLRSDWGLNLSPKSVIFNLLVF